MLLTYCIHFAQLHLHRTTNKTLKIWFECIIIIVKPDK